MLAHCRVAVAASRPGNCGLRRVDQRPGRRNLSLQPTPFPVQAQFPYLIVSDAIDFMKQVDHGDYLMDYGLGRKGVGLFECLTRIPMVWSGHGIRPSAVGSSAFTSMADVMPTLCEAVGAEIPRGVQGRSLRPLLLQGEAYPREEFRSIYSEVGVGGLYGVAYSSVPGTDTLNLVTQSGIEKMVRMGDWKLIYDMMGYGQLYHLPSDPCELKNLFGQPSAAKEQMQLLAELLMWTIRSQDSLPTGPQSRHYQTTWPRKHNWYAPYRHGNAPEAFIA